MACTFLIAAAIYCVLALHRLRYLPTTLVEAASAFVNRLLPSGLGGLGLHGLYLYKRKHTVAEATVVVSVNNLVGMAAHLALLAATLVLYPAAIHSFVHRVHVASWPLAVGGLVVGMVAVATPRVRQRLARFMQNLLASVRRLRLVALLCALGLALLLTITYTCILFSVTRSLGMELNMVQVFIVFSLAMLTSTAVPTPGGLVGAEAGLFAGFVAYGESAASAGAAALLYRLITYWLPLLPGLLALAIARRKKLV